MLYFVYVKFLFFVTDEGQNIHVGQNIHCHLKADINKTIKHNRRSDDGE